MELMIYEKEWLSISLKNISNEHIKKIPNTSFYDSFYKAFMKNSLKLDNGWVEYKRAVSDWIEQTILAEKQQSAKHPLKILSLAVGTGLIEEGWIKKGYDVYLQECQGVSLELIKKSCPEVKILICDARSIPCEDNAYHIVVFVTLDYVFDRKGYIELLQEIKRLLCPGGTTVCYCVSNITFKTALSELKRKVFHKKIKGIPWGYARTVAEHIKLGSNVGLIPQKIYLLEREIKSDRGSLVLKSIREPGFLWKLPANSSDVAVEFVKSLK